MSSKYVHIRRRLLAITVTIIAICILAVFGIVQMSKVAYFHELNARHLQASDDLEQIIAQTRADELDASALREAVANVRSYSWACLQEIGWVERMEITLLGATRLIELCQEDVVQADLILALIDSRVTGVNDASALTVKLSAAATEFAARSAEFMAPVTLVGNNVLRTVLVGMCVIALLGIAVVVGIVIRVNDAVKELHESNVSLAVSEERNKQMALFDDLTGLPNRHLFTDRLDQAITAVQRSQGMLALLYIDLDNFKNINDTLGHGAGDELLIAIAGRLQGVVRDADTVARLGGDEFAVVLSQVGSAGDVERVARRMLEVAVSPVTLNGFEHQVSASIGITLAPQDGIDRATLLSNADLAMYSAKSGGRNNCCFFAHGSDEGLRQRMRTEQLLRGAVAGGQLRLHYQPIVELSNGRTVGVEALLRWMHPEHGLVYPDSFIGVAEETGLIRDIGLWVLDAALAQCRQWQEKVPDFTMAVNVSVRQLRDHTLVDHLIELLKRHEVSAGSLHMEVTESLFLFNDGVAMSNLHLLGELGVVLSIDDFGTGYSSFGYLRQLPFRILKIDRSFISQVPENRDAVAVASAIVSMAQSLGMKVVAEGIETESHYDFLRAQHCVMGQGYLFSRPQPAHEFDPSRRFDSSEGAASTA